MRGGLRSWDESDGGALAVIACDKREAFAQGSEATKQSIYPRMPKDGLLRFARNDGEGYLAATTVVIASAGKLASSACSVLMVE